MQVLIVPPVGKLKLQLEVLGSANVSPLVFLTLLKALYSTFVLQMLTRQVLQRRANRLGLKFPTYE